jgi:hypothetical protein
MATQYLRSRHLQGTQEVLSNDLVDSPWQYRAPKILAAAAMGPDCWDCDFYRTHNYDLSTASCDFAFAHFVNDGQFEGRAHRCDQ